MLSSLLSSSFNSSAQLTQLTAAACNFISILPVLEIFLNLIFGVKITSLTIFLHNTGVFMCFDTDFTPISPSDSGIK